MTDDVRPEVVEAIVGATMDADFSEEGLAEILWNASLAERQAAADVHGALADLGLRKAIGLQYALTLLKPHWRWPAGTLSGALKTAPPEIAREAIRWLRLGGWGPEDGLPDEEGG